MAADPIPAHDGPFVPPHFTPPTPPRTNAFWLEPLGAEHNEADYAAWTSSMEHIKATPGFEDGDWPHPMSLDDNLGDLEMHADHFRRRLGFTYTVRSAVDDDVIGCVYIYPSRRDPEVDAVVRSWVRVSHAGLDTPLWSTVGDWLAEQWPFRAGRIEYAARPVR
jgi:hypothetical protein